MIYDIKPCENCHQLPDMHITGICSNSPRAEICCCGFRIEIQAKTKEEAFKAAVDAWNLKTNLPTSTS